MYYEYAVSGTIPDKFYETYEESSLVEGMDSLFDIGFDNQN